jgi:hypothetical protein
MEQYANGVIRGLGMYGPIDVPKASSGKHIQSSLKLPYLIASVQRVISFPLKRAICHLFPAVCYRGTVLERGIVLQFSLLLNTRSKVIVLVFVVSILSISYYAEKSRSEGLT